jgi:hypothetical protein
MFSLKKYSIEFHFVFDMNLSSTARVASAPYGASSAMGRTEHVTSQKTPGFSGAGV